MPAMTVSLVTSPSKSKGWGRWTAPQTDARSRTGNAWLYAGWTGHVPGQFTIRLQTSNRTKSGKETISSTVFGLLAEEGAEAILEHQGDPQGMVLRILGARLVAAGVRS